MAAGYARIEKGCVSESRWALGAVADRPILLSEIEKLMVGEKPSKALATQAHDLILTLIKPIDDASSSRSYRLQTAANLTRRWVLSLLEVDGA